MKKISDEIEDRIRNLLLTTKLPITDIAREVGVSTGPVSRILKATLTEEERKERLKMFQQSWVGDKNPNYGTRKDSIFIDPEGYVMMPKPIWYTGRKSSRAVYQHHVVMCIELGVTEIPKGYCVHHIDRDKTNNNLDNLMFLTFREHAALHRREDKR